MRARWRGYVYFVEFKAPGPITLIKIGYSRDLLNRLTQLGYQVRREWELDSDPALKILGVIECGMRLEGVLHNLFRRLRYQDEWFRDDEELRTFIEEARKPDAFLD